MHGSTDHRHRRGALALLLVPLLFFALPAAAGDEFRAAREAMVRSQLRERGIADPATLGAMLRVPRHRFVPERLLASAYDDTPLPIGHGQTISQPYIVAFMTEAVAPRPGMRVLEIGTGSGYQAAVLSEAGAEVYTVEIVPELAREAAKRLRRLGYESVRAREGDGYFGWEEAAPFDAIVVTAAAPFVPPPLLAQLREGGRMVIPVGSPFLVQTLMLVEKRDGELRSRALLPVRFVPFRRGG